MYEINRDRNGGLDYQYEDVVRRKEDRRHLEAGDCDCCHDVSYIFFFNIVFPNVQSVS